MNLEENQPWIEIKKRDEIRRVRPHGLEAKLEQGWQVVETESTVSVQDSGVIQARAPRKKAK